MAHSPQGERQSDRTKDLINGDRVLIADDQLEEVGKVGSDVRVRRLRDGGILGFKASGRTGVPLTGSSLAAQRARQGLTAPMPKDRNFVESGQRRVVATRELRLVGPLEPKR